MYNRTWGALTALAVLFATGSVAAHHYSAGVFDISKKVTMSGTLTHVDWRNPHIEVSMEVKGDNGKLETWSLESMAPSWFRGRSVSRADFDKALGHGEVTVLLHLAKDGSRHGLLQKITFPDGNSVTLPDVQTDPNGTGNTKAPILP